jgi:hypothetical protein
MSRGEISPSMNRGVNGSSREEARWFIFTVPQKVPFPDNHSPGVKGQLTKGHMALYSAILYNWLDT